MGSKRFLKVYRSKVYSEQNIPCIVLQGKWLLRLGFEIGSHVVVEEGPGKLVIRLVQEENNSDN